MRVECPACGECFNTTPPERFVTPQLDEVRAYCSEKKNGVDAVRFWNFYESKGWMVGKNKMKSWKAAIATWAKDVTAPGAPSGSKICPLCENYRMPEFARVCETCGPYCRKCGQQTARLTVVKRKDGTRSAVCEPCLQKLREARQS